MSRNEIRARIKASRFSLAYPGAQVSNLVGKTILHFEVIEKLGEGRLVPRSGRGETRPNLIPLMDVNHGR